MMVTQAGIGEKTESALFKQLGGQPKALGIVSFLLIALAIRQIAGPAVHSAGQRHGIGALLVNARSKRMEEQALLEEEEQTVDPAALADEPISAALRVDYMRLELGYGLLSLISAPTEGQRLTDQIKALRRQMAADVGFVMPSVRIQDNMQLPANGYVIQGN